jgi:hypothetical protein
MRQGRELFCDLCTSLIVERRVKTPLVEEDFDAFEAVETALKS